MDEVAGSQVERRETVGAGRRPFRPVGSLDHVDVVMDRPDVVGVALHDSFQHPDDLGGVPLRFGAAGLPVIPRRQVHQRFGGQHGDLGVGGVAPGDIHHGVGIGGVERAAVRRGIGGVAPGQRIDQRLFMGTRRRRQGLGPRHGGHGGGGGIGVHRRVDIRTQDQRLAPVAHGATGSICCALRKARRASAWLKP